jgi:hypothetical protein
VLARLILFVSAVASSSSIPASAQRLRDARTAVTQPITPVDHRDTTTYEANQNWGKRTAIGIVGVLGGAYAGYSLGHDFSRSGCDDPFCLTNEEFAGVIIGGVIGAAAGASFPDFNSRCALTERFLRGLAGSSLGLLVGAVVAFIAPAGGLVGFLFGPPIGASSAQRRCS